MSKTEEYKRRGMSVFSNDIFLSMTSKTGHQRVYMVPLKLVEERRLGGKGTRESVVNGW